MNFKYLVERNLISNDQLQKLIETVTELDFKIKSNENPLFAPVNFTSFQDFILITQSLEILEQKKIISENTKKQVISGIGEMIALGIFT